MSVSIIIVSFNTCEKLRKCLSQLSTQHEIIVVDNASSDGSVAMVQEEYPHVKVIANVDNKGFGTANNQGMGMASGDWVLLLNSDAYAEPGAVELLVAEAERVGAVAAGGRLLNLEGTLQNSSANELTLWAVFCEQTLLEKVFKNFRLFSPYWNSVRLLAQGEVPQRTPQVMGACLLMRPLERFDERFFLYCEDTELCHRLAKHGPIFYVPAAKFVHELGSSSKANWWLSVARYNRGKELYFRIHDGAFASWVCWVFDKLGALLRMLLWLPLAGTPRGRNKVVGFAKVLCA